MKVLQRVGRGLLVALLLFAISQAIIALAEYWGYPWRDYGSISVYLTTFLWCFMALGALIECALEEGADERELKKVKERSFLPLIPVARNSYNRAKYMTNQGVMKVCVGGFATYILFHIPPDPDLSPLQLALRLFFMLDIYWFWKTKRTDRSRRQNIQAYQGE